MKYYEKVKVIKLNQEKVMNLWGGYDDLTDLLEETGIVTTIINPDSGHAQYGIEFDNDFAKVASIRTRIIFSAEELELIA